MTPTDIHFPSHYTTTTTAREVTPEIRYDPNYLRAKKGLLKVAVIIFNLVGYICIEASVYNPTRATYFTSVAMTAFWFSLLMLPLYLFHVVEKLYRLPWVQLELGVYTVFTILYLIGSIFVASYPVGAFRAAAFFGFLCTAIYGYEAFVKFQLHKANFLAQGGKQSATIRVQTA